MEHSLVFDEPDHICNETCPDYHDRTKNFTLVIYKDLNNAPLLAKEWHYIFGVILIGLDILVTAEEITVNIDNARVLAKIIYQLNERLSSEFHISEYSFITAENKLQVEIGEH